MDLESVAPLFFLRKRDILKLFCKSRETKKLGLNKVIITKIGYLKKDKNKS